MKKKIVRLSMSPNVIDQIEKQAKKESRSFSNMIENIAKRYFEIKNT